MNFAWKDSQISTDHSSVEEFVDIILYSNNNQDQICFSQFNVLSEIKKKTSSQNIETASLQNIYLSDYITQRNLMHQKILKSSKEGLNSVFNRDIIDKLNELHALCIRKQKLLPFRLLLEIFQETRCFLSTLKQLDNLIEFEVF